MWLLAVLYEPSPMRLSYETFAQKINLITEYRVLSDKIVMGKATSKESLFYFKVVIPAFLIAFQEQSLIVVFPNILYMKDMLHIGKPHKLLFGYLQKRILL